uniref:Mucin 6, oligomeric mucus/gel-forming n=1 Tax=Colobus angolensis palliatus TaxID=336983 RepID=A0A2K5JBQ0_COLAP
MLRPWLLLSCCGTLLSTGLAATSYTSPGLWRLKDSPQTAPDKGQCSTWGAGHFSTFDHHVYDFSGTCNYIFAATCKDAFPTFSVQLRRGPDGSISRIIVELGASVVTVSEATISVKDVGVIGLPYTSNGLQITPFGQSVRLVAKQLELELEVMWGPDSHLMVLVERKYMGQMCGLCGNFDGKVTNEFVSEEGKFLEPHKFAALQKLDDPGEICTSEDIPNTHVRQVQHVNHPGPPQLLTLVAPECNVSKEPFVLSCQADVAAATQPGPQNSSCATLSEYSRQCSMLGQPVRRWRGPGLCSVGQCPANQVYQECGSACMKTCSNPQHSCSSSCTFGCFCPEGTVLNDLSSNHTCVPVTQCPCLLNGAMYAPGEVTIAACQTCQCTQGRWACRERPCPGHCSLEGGSFITTFDARPYRFHGTCTYILLQSPQLPEDGALMAVYDKSGFSHSETSLVAVIYLSRQDKIVISQDEVVTNNGEAKWLPYKTRNITVFRQTSTHLQMATSFGLELVVQLRPVFQAYITVGPQFRGQTRGLCGTFNGDTTDDFTTSVGIAEGTASLFVDSWRAGNCPAALERETDPCSMSQLNKVCAETHCSVLLRTGTVFERCHATVNPAPFYKRCVYQACNYEETFPHICAALGDYVHACSARGVPLWGWRSSVDNCRGVLGPQAVEPKLVLPAVPCTGNTTFSYNSQACERTCLSLSDRAAECHASAVPVDGCNCPNGTYLNHKGECVRKAQCPCTLEGYKFILAEQSTIINGWDCEGSPASSECPDCVPLFPAASCQAPKTFKSCNQSSENKFGAACAPTCQMLATGVACVPTKCEPGCVCAEGLYENADGQCVPPEECPCEFSGVSYPGGAELHTDCRTCTCSRGRWDCQQGTHCPSTCTLYGEGHIVTFDGQRFVFDGNCEYILATDGCGANDSQPTFKILTENVICGNSGVTCSRAIKIFLGGLSVVLADGNYTVTGEESHVQLSVRPGTLSLVVDISVPGRYNLTLIWNRHMTILIRITRASQDPLCGLCGNFNGNMKDDFETRSRYVASSELEFVNSWKESPLCGDVSFVADPCSLNTFRRSWAERKCSIINSQTFAACHSKVYHLPYYEACVRDACGCDSGGDCECLCDAVAAYAQACLDKGVCVDWRTPAFCPIYCGFYNTHTQDSHGEYQYTQEANCTWHYQPCLCPGQPESVPGSNIEGCYNCSQDEYFDHEEGVCVPCMPATTPQPSTTGSRPTQVWPTTGTSTTIGLLSSTGPSSSSKRTSASPTQTPLLPATLTSSKPTASSGEPPRPTTAVTPQATSGLPPTATLSSTATKPTVTQATTRATASTASPATTSTAQSTTRTTVTPPPPATSGTSPTLPKSTNQELPGTTATQTTGPRPTPESTTGPTTPQPGQPTRPTATETTQTGMTTEHTTPQTPHITHSPPVGSPIASTGPMTATSFQTTTTYPTPSHPQTTLPTHVPPFSTSLVTPSTHTVITTTHAQRSTSSSIHSVPIGTIPPPTTVKVTGSTHTAPPTTVTTSRTSQAHSSFSTTTASTSLHSHASSTHHPEITLTSTTTITPNPTSTGTGTPVAYTTLVTSSRPPPPFTTYSPLTGSTPVSSTGPMTATSFQTTTTYPTPSHPQTTLPTHVPPFSTSLVTPTTHTVITPTHIHLSTSASIHSMPTGTIPPPTALTTTGSMHTAPSMTVTTSGTSKAPSSFSTAKTSTSFYSHASSTHHPEITSTSTTTITPKSTSAGTMTTSVTSQAHSSFSTTKTSTSLHSHTSSTHQPEITPTSTTTITPNPTSTGTGTPVAHTTLATSSRLPTIFTTHSPPTGSTPVSSTGRMTATSFQTTTTYPTPSHPQTTLPTHVPPFSTSLVTPTTHTVITPTQTQMSTSASIYSMPTGTISPLTTVEATGSTHTAPPMTATTSGTSQALSSFSTAKTSTSLHSHSSSTHHPEVTPTSTTITPNPTTTGTGTPVAHTTSATSSRLPTPFTTHSPPTGSTPVSSTGPMTVTSFQSTTTYPTPSHPQTTLPTHVPPFSTSLVTPTTHIVITPTHPQMSTFSSIPSMPTGTISPSTMVKATGSTHTAPPMIVTTSGTRQTHSSFSTTTASSFLSSSSWRPQNSSSRPPSPPSATTQLPNLSSATTPVSTTNQLSSSFSPTPSAQSSVSSHVPSSHSSPQTSSSAGTSSSVVSTPVHSTTLSSSSHSFFTHPMTASGSASPLFPSSPAASTTIRASLPHTISSPFTLSALLPISTLTVSPTPSSHPASSTTAFLSTPRTTASTHAAPAFSSQSTTSRSTSLTTRVPTSGFVSLTWGVTGIPSSPVTNITTRHPGPTSLPTTQFLTSSLTAHGSAPASAPVSSLGTPTPTSPGVCSVQERQEEITFKGCMANVTVTRCEGTCISAASFNTITQQMDAHCGCCRPLHSHEQQLELPCPDPSAPGRWLILTLQVFSRCECSSVACGD